MGEGFAAVRWPQKCFNAQNHWHLGWFKDKSTDVDLSKGVQLFKVVPFIHYDKIDDYEYYPYSDPVILLKVGDLYMQFNVNEDFNRDTGEKQNQLVVVEDVNGDTNLLGGLDMNTKSLRWEDYFGNDLALLVEVCDLVLDSEDGIEYVIVSVGLDGSRCSDYEKGDDAEASDSSTNTKKKCEDTDIGWFMVDDDVDLGLRSSLQQCGWLREHPEVFGRYCSPGQAAYELCPETCNKCSKLCEDSKTAKIDIDGVQRDCDWLRWQPSLLESVCVPGSDASIQCKETCNSCEDLIPIANSMTVACDDSTTTAFWVDGIWGYQNCIWLKATPVRQPDLCVEGSAAYVACPETCGACEDNCNDLRGTFSDDTDAKRDCAWLSYRPYYWEQYCVDGHAANELCLETCQRC